MQKLVVLAASMISAAAPPAASPDDLRVKTGRNCPEAGVHDSGRDGSSAVVRRLDRLPPGRLELTVLRQIDRCAIPVVLREGIGGNPAAEARKSTR